MSDSLTTYSGISSLLVHLGHQQDGNYAHLTPIYATSTFVYDSAEQGMRRFSGREDGFIYSRWGNPTFKEAEEKIAAMESFGLIDETGHPLQLKAYLQASGMAAITTLLLSTLQAGDAILSHYSLYGGTQEQFNNILPGLGINAVIADLRNLDVAEVMLKQHPAIKLLYIETPANPTIQCVDIEALTTLAKKYGKIVACDNTFATPYLQQPFKYGVDFVVHSTTKFLNGHGTAIGGIFIGRNTEFMRKKAYKVFKALGGNASPFDAFMLVNGVKTLELRMERHCNNAEKVAHFLNTHPQVTYINYNGLPSHPSYAITQKQMRRPGAMLSFELKGGFDAGVAFMNKLQMCTRTVSLGTCDTLLCHPASMTHFGVPREQRLQYEITDGLIRMSVGIENIEDILNDLNQALT